MGENPAEVTISEFVFFFVSMNYNDLNMICILGWEFITPPSFGDSV